MKRPPRQYSREKRKEQIRLQFSVWHRNGDCEPKTMTRIAKALGLVPSPHVRDMLFEMVMEGDIIQGWRDTEGKKGAYTFLLVESRLITEKFSRRHISVKKRGVAVGQLVLPSW